jgi:hypothetical protein
VLCDGLFINAGDGKGNTALHYSLEMDDLQVSSSSHLMRACFSYLFAM